MDKLLRANYWRKEMNKLKLNMFINNNNVEIFFNELPKEKQEELLELYKVKSPKEMNWDTILVTTIEEPQDEERPYDFDDAIAGADRIFDMTKNMNIKQIPIILEELDSLRLGLQEIQKEENNK